MAGYLGDVDSACFGKAWAQLLDLQHRGGWDSREQQT